MSHSRGSKFHMKRHRNFKFDSSRSYKLTRAMKRKRPLKLRTYKRRCGSSRCKIHSSGKTKKKSKRKNLSNASFARDTKFSVTPLPVYKYDATKSPRTPKPTKEIETPKLLTYYKKLCRSSKCGIHNSTEGERRRKDDKTKELDVRSTNDDFEEILSSETIDIAMFEKIQSSVEDLDLFPESYFSNIVGYSKIRDLINKTIIWPLKKPETFNGLRAAPKGILLFGPPGTGKTTLVKLIAFRTKSTFFNISASTLTSKRMGDTEKLVRVLFLVARARQPSIIFIDEIHGLLSEKSKDENDSNNRLKNEFLSCMSSMETLNKNGVVIIGSTSRPEDIDERIRPKFTKRIYVPLPNENDRKDILWKLLERECHSIGNNDLTEIVHKTEGYSIVDLKNLCQEAAMSSIKGLTGSAIHNLKPNRIRPISVEDFESALKFIKPTVSDNQVKACEYWDVLYGYGGKESARHLQKRTVKDFYLNNPYVI